MKTEQEIVDEIEQYHKVIDDARQVIETNKDSINELISRLYS